MIRRAVKYFGERLQKPRPLRNAPRRMIANRMFPSAMVSPADRSQACFPLWLELSGLPVRLNEESKLAFAWGVFRKIVELDLAANPARPGMVEVSLAELGGRCGVDAARAEKAIRALRKAKLLRAFLPENEEEPALLQLLLPIATPQSPDEVRATHPDLFLEAEWPPRYAVAPPPTDATPATREEKIRGVVELYLNVFSMKINSLILDELQMIADRYEMALIEKVFERAKKREAASLGWVLAEIRRERKIELKAAELAAAPPEEPSAL